MGEGEETPPRVLISFSHDSVEHEERVRALSDRLRSDGIDCWIDLYEPAPSDGWPLWMLRQLRKADFVLLLCTATYQRRAQGEDTPGTSLGVRWETAEIYRHIYEAAMNNEKFIPCVLDANDRRFIVEPLRNYTHYVVGTDPGYWALYRRLTGQPATPIPPRGPIRKLGPGASLPAPAPEQFTVRASSPPIEPTYGPRSSESAAQRNQHQGATSVDVTSALRSRQPERHGVFIGRESELAAMEAALEPGGTRRVAIVAVQGMAGIGKTYLAQEFYARYAERFGSYRQVVLDPADPGTVATWAAVLGEQAGLDASRVDAVTVVQALTAQRALVHIDNVDSAAAAGLVAALADWLNCVPMLVTGRYTELGTAAGTRWTRIELTPLDPGTALELLQLELTGTPGAHPEELRELVRQVAGLPLALHLAAGYLRRGVTVARFLTRLRDQGLALSPRDPADHALRDRVRGVLATSFAVSRELLVAQAGTRAEAWRTALAALGWAPLVGFGQSLGAAITALDERGAFEDFVDAACALSLVRPHFRQERATPSWSVHPLLGEFLRIGSERAVVDARVGAWVTERADPRASERAIRWETLSAEAVAVGEWLSMATDSVVQNVLPVAWEFATSRGPVGSWLSAAHRVRQIDDNQEILWALCQLAFRAGELEVAFSAANDMERLAREGGNDRNRARALGLIADLLAGRGELDEALRILRERQLPAYERLDDARARANTLGQIADVLTRRGELDEALRLRREEQLPVYERLGDVRSRATTLGQIADVLARRGELHEALRIRRKEQLPVYERLGDLRSRAVTLGQIADVLEARGELDEVLRIRREEQLPVYDRLGDVRSRAITLGQIADVLAARGDLDEAQRIRREEQLPVYERLGDVHERAITLGKIADVLAARGELEKALQIRREELLPVYERLGDVHDCAITRGQIGNVLAARGEFDEALRIWREEELPVYERLGDVQARAITLGKIADVLATRGEWDEALRIRREEQLPVYERLGDIRSAANTLGKIADILAGRGRLDEAERVRRREQLPVYERLGDVRATAITLGRIADLLAARGNLDEALRIWREQELPVHERLGDVLSRAITIGKIADVLAERGEPDEALRIWREEELPVYERLGDVRARAITMGRIADVLATRGELDEALQIWRDEELPVYERLGDVRLHAITMAKIADVLAVRGASDDALTTWRECLTVFERLRAPDLIEAANQRIAELTGQ
jgi:tetratricopeptide (TPR) repeat protein